METKGRFWKDYHKKRAGVASGLEKSATRPKRLWVSKEFTHFILR